MIQFFKVDFTPVLASPPYGPPYQNEKNSNPLKKIFNNQNDFPHPWWFKGEDTLRTWSLVY